jgi:hypothetical protein
VSAGVGKLGDITYTVTLRTVVLATREGLDVGLLRAWMDALVFETEHTLACLGEHQHEYDVCLE